MTLGGLSLGLIRLVYAVDSGAIMPLLTLWVSLLPLVHMVTRWPNPDRKQSYRAGFVNPSFFTVNRSSFGAKFGGFTSKPRLFHPPTTNYCSEVAVHRTSKRTKRLSSATKASIIASGQYRGTRWRIASW